MSGPSVEHETAKLGWRSAGLIAAVALSLRFAYLGVACMAPDFYAPYLDGLWHVQWAKEISQGHPIDSEPFFRAPLYPYALGGLFALTGPDLLDARVAQIILGSLTAVLVGMLGARLFGRRVGSIAGIIYAASASLVLFDLEFLLEVLFLPLVVLSLLALEATTCAPSPPRFVALGLALGTAAICRPNILLFVPVALGLALLVARHQGWTPARLATAAGLLCVGLAVPILPVTAHNILAGHDAVLIASQGGVNFYIGNCAEATGDQAFMPGPTDTATYAKDGTYTDNVMSSGRFVAQKAAGHPLKASEVSAFWTRAAIAWVTEHPVSWLKLMGRKVFYLIGGFEIGDECNLAAAFSSWAPFAALPRWWWLFPLAVVGLGTPGDGKRGRIILGGFSAAYAASVVLFFCTERFRLPLYPALCVLAARGVFCVVENLHARKWRHATLQFGALVAVASVTTWDPFGYTTSERADALRWQARALARSGNLDEAEERLLDSLALTTRARREHPANAARLGWGAGRPTVAEVEREARQDYAVVLALRATHARLPEKPTKR
jgi:4-amino-4-deoxy-L-arabinose transferase-like glycosyltransferase